MILWPAIFSTNFGETFYTLIFKSPLSQKVVCSTRDNQSRLVPPKGPFFWSLFFTFCFEEFEIFEKKFFESVLPSWCLPKMGRIWNVSTIQIWTNHSLVVFSPSLVAVGNVWKWNNQNSDSLNRLENKPITIWSPWYISKTVQSVIGPHQNRLDTCLD